MERKNHLKLLTEYKLLGNFPNPFNPSTTIKYSLPKESNIELRIYDMLGKEIKCIIANSQAAGNHNIIWDGTNNSGASVSSGIYIYRFIAKSSKDGSIFDKSAKLLMIK